LLYTVEGVLVSKSASRVVVVMPEERAGTYEKLRLEVIIDELGIGPIRGVTKALEELDNSFIAAGDMPLVKLELVDFIMARTRRQALMTASQGTWTGPRAPPRLLLQARNGHARGGGGEERLLDHIRAQESGGGYLPYGIPPRLRHCLRDVDTPRDLTEVASLLKPAMGVVP